MCRCHAAVLYMNWIRMLANVFFPEKHLLYKILISPRYQAGTMLTYGHAVLAVTQQMKTLPSARNVENPSDFA